MPVSSVALRGEHSPHPPPLPRFWSSRDWKDRRGGSFQISGQKVLRCRFLSAGRWQNWGGSCPNGHPRIFVTGSETSRCHSRCAGNEFLACRPFVFGFSPSSPFCASPSLDSVVAKHLIKTFWVFVCCLLVDYECCCCNTSSSLFLFSPSCVWYACMSR